MWGGEDTPRTSSSWSEETVLEVDKGSVQVPFDVFASFLSGSSLSDAGKLRLNAVDGLYPRNAPGGSQREVHRSICDILNAVEELAGSRFCWKLVSGHGDGADAGHAPSLARYPTDIPAAQQACALNISTNDRDIARCAWAWMNSIVVISDDEENSPFLFSLNLDDDGQQTFLRQSIAGKKARDHLIQCVTEANLHQHRTHYFSFYLSGGYARALRWDRVGCIVSEPIDLRDRSEDFLDIFHRLATSPDYGGVDSTVVLASQEEVAALEQYDPGDNTYLRDHRESMLSGQLDYPIYKTSCSTVSLDGREDMFTEKTYLIGRHFLAHFSPVGRCTRGYPALDLETNRLVWLKDQWRSTARPHTELEAYVRLHKHNVSYIATPIAGGDVVGQRTLTQDYLTYNTDERRPAARMHTRLVTMEVGRPLETYEDSLDLMCICTHAFCAHQQAWESARILHGDISVANIMIDVETGSGFLNDWDLCSYREEMDAKLPVVRPTGVSGTWAFKSALSLRYPRKPAELADDLESFIYVITFLAYRFHLHDLSPKPVEDTEDALIAANAENPELMGFVSMFFHARKRAQGGWFTGGGLKHRTILSGLLPIPFKPLPNGKISLVESFLGKAYELLQEHCWSLNESELVRFAAHDDEPPSDDVATIAATETSPQDNSGRRLGHDSVYATLLALNDGRSVKSSQGKAIFWDKDRRTNLACPIDDPQPVLETHIDLAWLFVSVARDEYGNDLDLRDYRDDKRFDQFLSEDMVRYLERKRMMGQREESSSSAESAAKRKRPEDDTGEEASTPAKKPATRRMKGRGAKAPVDGEEKTAKGKSKANAKTTAAQKAPASRAPAKKGPKSQPTKTATKATASRKAQVARKPASPRRPAAVKAAVTGKGRGSKARAEPSVPVRRSARLANKAS